MTDDKKPAEKPPAPRTAAKGEGETGADKAAAPKAAAKKEKPPALEDKPFAEFIQQDYLPALKAALEKQGIADLSLALAKQKIPVTGFAQEPECWQIVGTWEAGKRQFNLYFFKEDIQGHKAFSYTENAAKASTLESFLIDERKVTLDLMVFGIMQRLNAQKWLVRN
ncbi:DUF2996 domain-containing protein [Leptolyngbya sp. 'hensonii']|uniref:DUF2996 domain-containing protein n=1 Tax=Leptolyngbya sp. 'hensonii' TaxID=1922337 RepID=UPI001C0B1012|nr:DUF2996 domain-containing protein [Leptolyngbya sp. 'hensonii']